MNDGFIKVWRRMLDSAVMSDDWICRLWMWCMLKAQWKQADRAGAPSRGQFFTGQASGSEELMVSPSKWYRGMRTLCDLGCITMEANSKKTTVTVCNYATYQDNVDEIEQPLAIQMNNERIASEQRSLEEECKKERKVAVVENFDPLSIVLPAALDTPRFSAAWSEWINYRRERRLSLRERTVAKQISTFAIWGELRAIEAIDASIRNGWQGVFEPRKQKPEKPNIDDDDSLRRIRESREASDREANEGKEKP